MAARDRRRRGLGGPSNLGVISTKSGAGLIGVVISISKELGELLLSLLGANQARNRRAEGFRVAGCAVIGLGVVLSYDRVASRGWCSRDMGYGPGVEQDKAE